MQDPVNQIKSILEHIEDFTSVFGRVQLRPYQVEAADAVIRSILANDGETFVWKFSRQGGKDETLAALYQYIMTILAHRETSIVSACPTFLPQTRLSIDRLSDRLSHHLALKRSWKRQAGHIFKIHRARTLFLSAQSHANVVGATAWPLLVMNEAQDIAPAVYDKRFAPMAAANNATRLFCGTAWTRNTLLAREEQFCRLKEQKDGLRRVFIVDAAEIAKVHPPYGKFLESEIARLGPNHPIVVSQYLCREIDSQVGMFPPARLALMFAERITPPLAAASPIFGALPQMGEGGRSPEGGPPSIVNRTPQSGASSIAEGPRSVAEGVNSLSADPSPSSTPPLSSCPYAFTIDVAGMDEFRYPVDDLAIVNHQSTISNPRDSTTLSIVAIDLSTLETLHAPTYRVVHREAWQGQNHLTVFGKLKALFETWKPQHIVIDATGVGEGLWAMLDRAYNTRVIPVKFTQQEKSEIGWRFLSIIETGRFRAFSDQQSAFSESVRIQYENCQSEILPGPGKILRWGVPDGTRGPDGELVHDDFILADALVAKLDLLKWSIRFEPFIVRAKDPLDDMSKMRRAESGEW